jgi:hypothetical protein
MGSGSLARGGRWGRSHDVVSLLVAIVVAIVIAGGAPAGARAEGVASVAAPQLNLRTEPSTWAPVAGQLWQGERLALLDGPTPDDWYYVQTGDQTGWAYGGLLALDGAGDGLDQAPSWAVDSGERWVDVDRTMQTVTLYEGDSAVATYWAAMGSDSSADGFFATAVGTYAVYEKYGGLSWTNWGGAWVDDWVGFDPARLNGFHTYAMDMSGQVIPGGDGPTGGCVALAPAAADQLFAFVAVGTRVEVHD